MKELGLLVLGWLLGLLGPAVVDAIRRRRENAMGRAAILSELREVGCLLSSATWGTLHLYGKADRALLDWVKNDLERHGTSEQFNKIVANLRKTLTWDDDELRKYNACLAREHDGKGTMLQRYPVPLLDARVSAYGHSTLRSNAGCLRYALVCTCWTTSSPAHKRTSTGRSRCKASR